MEKTDRLIETGGTLKQKYDTKDMSNILTEQAVLNETNSSLFVTQSQDKTSEAEGKMNTFEERMERGGDQSKTNKTFQNEHHVHKNRKTETATSGQSDISTVNASSIEKIDLIRKN